MPALVQAQHSDKPSVVELLKDYSIKANRTYTDYTLYTLPVRPALVSDHFLKTLGLLTSGPASNGACMEVDADQEENEDFLKIEKQLCELVKSGNLHWRHFQMAIGMLLSSVVPGYEPSKEVVEMWLDCLLNDDITIRLIAIQV